MSLCGRKANAGEIVRNKDRYPASFSRKDSTPAGHRLQVGHLEQKVFQSALSQLHYCLEKNTECRDEHTPRTGRLLRIESCLHDNLHKLGSRDVEARLFYVAFEHGVEVYH